MKEPKEPKVQVRKNPAAEQIRQGDVLFMKIGSLPDGYQPVTIPPEEPYIVKHGETSGHVHQFPAGAPIELYRAEGTSQRRVVHILETTELQHILEGTQAPTLDHDFEQMVKGWYIEREQVEFTDDDQLRAVAD